MPNGYWVELPSRGTTRSLIFADDLPISYESLETLMTDLDTFIMQVKSLDVSQTELRYRTLKIYYENLF